MPQQPNTMKGKNTIGFRLQRNNGKRIYYRDISSESVCNPKVTPTTHTTITNEYELEEAIYPCSYTLMVFTKDSNYADY